MYFLWAWPEPKSRVCPPLSSVSGGTLQDLLSAQPVLTEHVASLYTRKIAEGLEYLHDDKIILVNLSVSYIVCVKCCPQTVLYTVLLYMYFLLLTLNYTSPSPHTPHTHTRAQPDNILLTYGHKDIKICDLGLSRYIESGNQLSRLEGRVEYMSPEVVALQPLTTAADVWSLGTITYLM